MNHKIVVSVLAVAATFSVASLPAQAQTLRTQHVHSAALTGEAQAVGRLSAKQSLQLDVVLSLRDESGLDQFLEELYNPASSQYRRYLTPAEFTERFGPTKSDYTSVVSYLRAHGLVITGGSRAGMDVQVQGTVEKIESAFHVQMKNYTHPTEDRFFYGPDREPTIDLPISLWHISGLTNYSIPKPHLIHRDTAAKVHGVAPEALVAHATTGSGPSASFLGSDMRAAYYGGSTLTGSGQTLGLLEYYGTDLADLATYYKNVGQTYSTKITLLSTDGTSTSCLYSAGCDDGEQNLDMTQALGMAPGLSNLIVYVGSTDTAILASMTTSSPLPATIGCSWGWTPADPTTLDPYFKKMSAQGQTFFAASGDSSTWSSSNEAWPADDVNVVAVGGTDLVTAKAAGAWKSETAWADSGGGISPDKIAIPSWQSQTGVITSTNKGSTKYRNGPDVSANANFTFYTCGDQTTCQANEYGGTSFAAPMWAAYLALVNQQRVANGKSTIGFINSDLYTLGLGSTTKTDFHDITSGKSGSYSAVTGFDLVTGWGSPNGTSLLNALAAE